MPRQLRIWNGRDWDGRGGRIFIAAHSVADASRLHCEAKSKIRGKDYQEDKLDLGRASREIKTYFTEGCWGDSMSGITPERGVWHCKTNTYGCDDGKPEKVI